MLGTRRNHSGLQASRLSPNSSGVNDKPLEVAVPMITPSDRDSKIDSCPELVDHDMQCAVMGWP